MDQNEVSVLSDDLKPRRTPELATFKVVKFREQNSVPRPSVPDLSIIECASSSDKVISNQRSNSSLRNLTYNEWRKANGYGGRCESSKQISNSPGSFVMVNPPKKNILDCISKPPQKYGLSDSAPCLGKTVSYSDFKSRPTSAPVQRHLSAQVLQSSPSPPCAATAARNPLSCHEKPENYDPCSSTDKGSSCDVQAHMAPRKRNSGHVIAFSPTDSKAKALDSFETGRSKSVPPKAVKFPNHMHSPDNLLLHPHSSVSYCQTGGCGCQTNLKPCCHKQAAPSALCCFRSSTSPTCLSSLSPCHLPENNLTNIASANPSFDDLCRIVLAQNNELKNLQAQVEKLLQLNQDKTRTQPDTLNESGSKRLSSPRQGAPHVTMVCEEGTQTSDSETVTESSQKMSIGVMTSFMHAVAYSGRLGLRDMKDESCRSAHDSNFKKGSSCSDSDGVDSSSGSDCEDRFLKQNKSSKKCKDCHSKGRSVEKLPQRAKIVQPSSQKGAQCERKSLKSKKTGLQSESTSSQAGSCSNPGVSAAISAVRGCQAVLASNANMRFDESLTFNAGDLPSVPEQPVSPMSSIHVDIQDYRESTTDETDSSESDEYDDSINKQLSDPSGEDNSNRWKLYNKMLGNVNKILTEKTETKNSPTGGQENPQNIRDMTREIMPSTSSRGLDSSSKKVAFHAPTGSKKTQNLKELALRYLRENHPEELAPNCAQIGGKFHSGENIQEMAVYNVPASNMSFATFRYLERYNLLPENFNPEQYLEAAVNVCRNSMGNPLLTEGVSNEMNKVFSETLKSRNMRTIPTRTRPKPQLYPFEANKRPARKGYHKVSSKYHDHNPPPKQHLQVNTPPSKILDITALRQQPKLL